ncbi:MAG: helix-turn-helix transcriptional regulator [Ruminococcus sp.]
MDRLSYFSENLVRLRKATGMTQQQVAEKLGINRTTYTKYETGVTEPSFEMLLRISELLGVGIDTLFNGGAERELLLSVSDSKKSALSDDEVEILEAYRSLSEKERAKIRDGMKKLSDKK